MISAPQGAEITAGSDRDGPAVTVTGTVPSLDDEAAAALVHERWGIDGTVRSLGSHEDVNFLVEAAAGRYVLKLTSPATSRAEVEAQGAGLLRLALAGLPFDSPTPLAARDGSLAVDVEVAAGPCVARLLTWVEGRCLSEWRHLAPPVLRALGAVAGRTAAALAGLDHPALDRPFAWDCRRTPEVVRSQVASVPSERRRALALGVVDRVEAALAPLAPALRVEVIHGDVTDLNVTARAGDDGRPVPCGLIDVGDLSAGWVVAEAAVAACSAVGHAPGRTVQAVVEVARGFHDTCRLTSPEVEALWWVILGRAAVLATSAEHQAVLDPGNDYVTSSIEGEWANLEALWAVPPALACEALRLGLGLDPSGTVGSAPVATVALVDWPGGAPGPVVDRSVTSEVAGRVPDGAVGRHGEGRLDESAPAQDEPATVSLGCEVTLPADAAVRSPVDAVVRGVGSDRVVLAVERGGLDIVLRGLAPSVVAGDVLAAGSPVGAVGAAGELHVVAVAAGIDPPRRVPGSLAGAWLAVCPDPSPLLGLAPGAAVAPRPDPEALLARRAAVLADVQEHYWSAPPMIERGRGTRLYDTDGRAYLDAINNVAVLGHSHPAVEAAVSRQLRLLNTNSRFHYEAIVAYAERLVGLLPDPLDTVFLVSTGSEACDLALRLIRSATGSEHVLALRGAYHGWTMATDAVSTSLHDNPAALGSRPPWVHLVEAPDTYCGPHRGADAGARYAEDVARAIDELTAAGARPAGFIAEPLSGNAGGIVLPEGYLALAYEQVRAAGGLCIADEVQTGLGRLGDWYWAFESHGVVPDVVTVAKATGNGVPVGAVITTRAIAGAFAAEGSFFSSVGGSPMSAAAGLAVLDTIEAEKLQANARVVGAHLRRRLQSLVDRFPLCGAVHGHGLYLGLELVRDPSSLEPAGPEATAICERALELGLVVQPTGDGASVLKIKPPLCFTEADADHLVEVLERILTEGW